MHKVKITLAYDGTNYKGWQFQPKDVSVQRTIEEVLQRVYGKHIRLHGASRTDTGVHARMQVAHFNAPFVIPESKIPIALNTFLPEDIVVTSAEYMPEKFNAQFDAKVKKYEYVIFNARTRDPFTQRFAWRVPYKMDIALMRKELKCLEGKHDFKSFQTTDNRERTSVREIFKTGISKRKGYLVITMEGSGFLYNMVRNVVGTLIDVGRGHLPKGSIKKILESKNRSRAGNTAPAKGLCLVEIKF